jgi:hypothetical protein
MLHLKGHRIKVLGEELNMDEFRKAIHNIDTILNEMTSTTEKIIKKLEDSFREDEAAGRAKNPEIALEEFKQATQFANDLSSPVESLLRDPISETTRKRQQSLYVASLVCILATQNFIELNKIKIGAYEFTTPTLFVLTVAMIVFFFIITFLFSWRRTN